MRDVDARGWAACSRCRRAVMTGLRARYWRTLGVVVGVVAQTVVIAIIAAGVAHNTTDADKAKADAATAKTQARIVAAAAVDRARVLADALQAVCEQGQTIRREMNRRIKAGSVDRSVLLEALRIAGTRGPFRKAFSHLREIERENVHFVALPIPKCEGPPPRHTGWP